MRGAHGRHSTFGRRKLGPFGRTRHGPLRRIRHGVVGRRKHRPFRRRKHRPFEKRSKAYMACRAVGATLAHDQAALRFKGSNAKPNFPERV
ncbi:hypothetical protein Tco_0043265 [Tanacetum coccineum]